MRYVTDNSNVKSFDLTFDFDLQFKQLGHVIHILYHQEDYLSEVK